MKKIVILLSFVLSAFIISSCAENNPNNPSDNTQNNNITLAERAGTYSGQITQPQMSLIMVLDNTGTLTSLIVNENESVDPNSPIKVGDPNSKETVFGPFTANVTLMGQPSNAEIKVTFKSGTDKTQGATANIDITPDNVFNPTINTDLQYQAN